MFHYLGNTNGVISQKRNKSETSYETIAVRIKRQEKKSVFLDTDILAQTNSLRDMAVFSRDLLQYSSNADA